MVIRVPVKLLHEAHGLHVTVELQTGQSYRGRLHSIEDNMNCQLREVIMTARDGQQTALEHVFLRGSQVRFVVVPDNLRHCPELKSFNKEKKGKGMGMGFGHDQIKAAQANRR